LLDRYLATAAWNGAMLPEAVDPTQPDNFWSPLPGDHGSHGHFDTLARDFSPQLWATEHRTTLVGGLPLLGAGLAARHAMRRSRCGKTRE
jgi:hypothetical protein